MEARCLSHRFEEVDSAGTPSLELLIAYEDFGTALRAKHSLDLLPERISFEAKFSTRLWKLDLLREPLLKEQAAVEAAGADVIILSVHGRSQLPVQVCEWLSRWQDHKEDRPYAFGLLLDPEVMDSAGHNPVLAHVRRFVTAAGADLFYGFCETPASHLDLFQQDIHARVHRSSVVLDKILQRAQPHPRGGIND